jgi:hypothetical protein
MVEIRSLVRSVRRFGQRLRGTDTDTDAPLSLAEPPEATAPVPEDVAPPPAPLAVAPQYQGYVDERSAHHLHGWARNLNDADERVELEVVHTGTGARLGRVRSDQFRAGLREIGVGDGKHAYFFRFDAPVDEAELALIDVRCIQDGHVLPVSPHVTSDYQPVTFLAMDIVDNCNLRCPFCLYDYANTRATNFMNEDTIAAAVRFAPFIPDGLLWFSCLHEPTLHPKLMDYVNLVPDDLRRKLFYTTNLAKRMKPEYFEWLANSGMHHINISIESMQPALYERMRKGARFRIFMENWDKLIPALKAGRRPPQIRYIAMAYKSNLRELPGLVKYLHEERLAHQVELRYSFDVPHMPAEFKRAEFLEPRDWYWLVNELRAYTPEQLIIDLPPGVVLPPLGSNDLPAEFQPLPEGEGVTIAPDVATAAEPAADGPADPPASQAPPESLLGKPMNFDFPPLPPGAEEKFVRGRYWFQLTSGGRLTVNRAKSDFKDGDYADTTLMVTDIRNIEDPAAFLRRLPY